ncbi:MAG: hypothetical protein ACFFCI_10845 [Promethearchaeota archaeon]
MVEISSRIRLLALLSIFFIVKAIMEAIEGNTNQVILWLLITIIYISSFVILYFVIRRWEKERKI